LGIRTARRRKNLGCSENASGSSAAARGNIEPCK
jgi:hypothetical protein